MTKTLQKAFAECMELEDVKPSYIEMEGGLDRLRD